LLIRLDKRNNRKSRFKSLSTLPNILFVLYLLIAVPIFYSQSISLSVYTIGEFTGYSIIPIVFFVVYNLKKKDSKAIMITSSIITI
jgi:hypothetical protein